jgi:DNA-directed RNA polymerase subunit RPC12/RpoP
VTALTDACADIGPLLARAAALVTEPDTGGVTSSLQFWSRPPWNPAAAGAYLDPKIVIRDIEQLFRLIITGRTAMARSWSDANDAAALDAIEKLSHAIPQEHYRRDGRPCRCPYCQASRSLNAAVTVILLLPAVDELEPARRLEIACPYCQVGRSLRAYPRSGEVTCLRRGACFDSDGNHPRGQMEVGMVSGPGVRWADGLVWP